MRDQKILFRGSVFLLTSVLWASGCNLAQKSASKSSADALGEAISLGDSVSTADESQPSIVAKNEAYKPLTGRMDGVEFYINQELMTAGLDKVKIDSKSDFKELQSVFDQSSKMWQPQNKGYSIPVVRNQHVQQWINYFNGPIRSNFERWIRRGSQYVPVMEKILKEEGVPADLIYLSMIESGFNTQAYSHAHAAGLWQFIPSTGRMYGLESGGAVDERRDIIKATYASARHLKDLYKMYNDWYLAFAAYNAGPGTVNRALKNSNTRDFWQLAASKKRLFRQETKDYVPRILAAAIIMKNYKKYGYSSDLFQKPMTFESLEVPDATDINTLAEAAGLSVEEMKFYNPSLVSGMTPIGQPYVVHVPVGTSSSFKKNYAKLAPNRRVIYATHKVHKRETLTAIAKKYKTTEKIILASNKLSSAKQVRAGMKLTIPRQVLGGKMEPVKEVSTVAMSNPVALRSGSTAFDDKTDTENDSSLEEILGDDLGETTGAAKVEKNTAALINQEDSVAGIPEMTETKSPEVTTEQFRLEPARTYKVKKGDTLASIASKHKTTIADVRKWNQFSNKTIIRTGQTIKVSAQKKIKLDPIPATTVAVIGGEAAEKQKTNEVVPVAAEQLKSTSVPQNEAVIPSEFKSYQVQTGDSLAQIAVKNGVTVALIREWNALATNDVVHEGQTLKIGAPLWAPPSSAASVAATPASRQSVVFYKVKAGDTLPSIAAANNVYVKDLIAMNGVGNSAQLKVGQVLKLQSGALSNSVSATKSPTTNKSGKMIIHAVRKGETLWTLSQKYGVTVAKIKEWNGLKANSLNPNQKLKIYSFVLGKQQAA